MLPTNSLANVGTMYVAKWIRHNRYAVRFGKAQDINEFKRMVKQQLWGNDKPSESFIKGARLINWEALYQAVKSL